MTEPLELLLLSDVHNGPPFEAKAGPQALAELRMVLERLEREPAELLIDLGDRINNVSAEDDLKHMREVAAAFAGSSKDRHHLLGNHDVKLLSVQDNAQALGLPVGHRILRRSGWSLLLWSPPPYYRADGCLVSEEDVAWLREALDGLDGPAVLFTHVPLGGGTMRGNYYFEGAPAAGASYRELERLQEMILAHDHVKAAVAGHVHWNSLNVVDGVPFLTIQSLSELATTAPAPAGAWAKLRLEPGTVELEVYGRDPFLVRLPLREGGRHWLRRPGMRPWRPAAPMRSPAEATGVILDLDGVIYRGDELLPGAAAFVRELRERGVGVVAVSNHSGASSAALAAKLARLGVPFADSEVVTSIDATVAFLRRRFPAGTPALVVGSEALRSAVAEAGFPLGSSPGVVVVGYQDRRDEAELAAAAAAAEDGAPLVGTNLDGWLPSQNGTRRPETGPYVAMVAAMAGRQPSAILGKPNPYIGELALERLGKRAREVLVVGDTLATDISLAKAIGAASSLVLTGNAQATDMLVPRPDFVFADLPALARAMSGREAVEPGPETRAF